MPPAQAQVTNNPLQEAFTHRRPLMPWSSGAPIATELLHDTWKDIIQSPSTSGDALAYVHIPICSTHCLFCHFYRNATRQVDIASYADQVVHEISVDAASLSSDTRIQAIYLGGGTPTDLDASSLHKIIHALRTELPLAENCEITVEGRPYSFTDDKVEACLGAGANRFSFGVQTFDTALRQRLGRKKTGPEIVAFLKKLRTHAPNTTLVIDLIYGLPGQTESSWREDLNTLDELGLDGVDLYCYSMLPGSPLAKAIQLGRFSPPHATSSQARFYGIGSDWMESHRWPQISSAHFAATPRERNAYNRLVKAGLDCHAFGAGAGGKRNGYAYQNLSSLDLYRASIECNRKPLASLTRLCQQAQLYQLVMAEVEAGRISPHTWPHTTAELRRDVVQQLRFWHRAGLLRWEPPTACLTPAGRFWHSNLTLGLQDIVTRHLRKPASTFTS